MRLPVKVGVLMVIFLWSSIGWATEKNLSHAQEYNLSEQCGQRAEAFYKMRHSEIPEYIYEENGMQRFYLYTNHYNKRLNKCFIRIEETFFKTDSSDYHTYAIDVYDVNEHVLLARYMGESEESEKIPVMCYVSSKVEHCTSKTAWEIFIKSYMEAP